MAGVLQNIFTIITYAESVAGSFANIFIVVVNVTDWIQRKRISSADQILTGLAVSRVLLLWVTSLTWLLGLFNSDTHSTPVSITLLIAWIITNHFSIWFATSLSVFYLLKIANFSSFIFLHLKRRINSVISVILLGTLVLLFLNLVVLHMTETMNVKELEGNTTWKTKPSDAMNLSHVTVFTLVNSIPCITSLICFLLLLYSLCKHLGKVRLHGRRPQDPSTRIHVKAVRTVVSFLLLFAIYAVFVILGMWNHNGLRNGAVSLLCRVAGTLYPSGHSFILIWGNKKLRENFLLVVWQVRCWVKDQKPSSRSYQ